MSTYLWKQATICAFCGLAYLACQMNPRCQVDKRAGAPGTLPMHSGPTAPSVSGLTMTTSSSVAVAAGLPFPIVQIAGSQGIVNHVYSPDAAARPDLTASSEAIARQEQALWTALGIAKPDNRGVNFGQTPEPAKKS